MAINIESNGAMGRIFWTDLGKQKVSTVNLKIRETFNPMVGIRNDMFAIVEKYETAVIDENQKFICAVGRTNSIRKAEKIHRKTVKKIIKGTAFSKADDLTKDKESIFTSRKQLNKFAKYKGWV